MPIPSGTSVPFLGTQKTTVTRLRKVLGKMFPPPTFWAPTLRLQLGGDVEHVQSAQGGVIYIVVYGTAAELRHRHCTLWPLIRETQEATKQLAVAATRSCRPCYCCYCTAAASYNHAHMMCIQNVTRSGTAVPGMYAIKRVPGTWYVQKCYECSVPVYASTSAAFLAVRVRAKCQE